MSPWLNVACSAASLVPSTSLIRVSNPVDQDHLRAVGLGLAVVGVGFTLSGIYRHPAWAWASVFAGSALTLFHWNGVGQKDGS
jgi:hypothetical protein